MNSDEELAEDIHQHPNPGSGKVERGMEEAYRVLVTADDGSDREWQCVECGKVETGRRPGHCTHCNCVDDDMPDGVRLFARRESVGWFE